jgi:hypothetical protein
MFEFKEDKSDSPMLIYPRIIVGDHWKSFSIVVEDINYFGCGSQENWVKSFEKLDNEYYSEFERTNQDIIERKLKKIEI